MSNNNENQKKVIIDLGCGGRKHENSIGMDNVALDGVDVIHDLLDFPYPFDSEYADEIILSHVLEHFEFTDIVAILKESHRILKPNGNVTISVPHAFSVAYFTDPTHKTSFTFETLYYFSEQHRFNYYKNSGNRWHVQRIWGSVNLFNNHFYETTEKQKWLENQATRALRFILRNSKTTTVPDLIVKSFPFWLVNIHGKLSKISK